ncbi:isocitrate dehydrogenase [Striga asiatica]|uniref:Isocitrate dehydrogenase n=1 Tax=Striga asiatica TaxID=4170 RepID=A0A5A7QF13_STRAF|nr:isocitrate dehydrogenase [Striga asiatica]
MDHRPILYRPYLSFFLLLHGWLGRRLLEGWVIWWINDVEKVAILAYGGRPILCRHLFKAANFFDWSFSSAAASVSNLIRANVFPGDGIGPHIAKFVKQHGGMDGSWIDLAADASQFDEST